MNNNKSKAYQKIKYEVDDLNRLVISKPYEVNSPPKEKRIIKGYFKSNKNNEIAFKLKDRYKKNLGLEVCFLKK